MWGLDCHGNSSSGGKLANAQLRIGGFGCLGSPSEPLCFGVGPFGSLPCMATPIQFKRVSGQLKHLLGFTTNRACRQKCTYSVRST